MRLNELLGVKKYKERTIGDVIRDFQDAGGEWLGSGKYANVIGHPSWNYVWKFFAHDPCYLKFVRYALRNDDPAFPVFYTKPRRIVPFYMRPTDQTKIYVIKMERLEPIKSNYVRENIRDWIDQAEYYFHMTPERRAQMKHDYDQIEKYRDDEGNLKLPRGNDRYQYMGGHKEYSRMQDLEGMFKSIPGLKGVCEAIWTKLSSSGIQCEFDLHADNIMQRPSDGTLVVTDPFWPGMNPMQLHDYLMKQETEGMDDYEPDPYNMVKGGETKPPKRPKPTFTSPTYGDDDIPF